MPTDDRPTRDLDQFALLRALIERAAAENATSNAALALEMKSVVGTVDGLRHEVHRLAGRVTGAEEDIRELRDKDANITRHVSSSDLEHEAAIGGAIAHVAKLEETVQTTAKVQEAICGELGIDHTAIVAGRASIPPPGGKAPRTTLKKIAVENKGGALMAAITLGLMIAQIVAHLLGVHLVGP